MKGLLTVGLLLAAVVLAAPVAASARDASLTEAEVPKGWTCFKTDFGRVCEHIKYRLSLQKPLGTPIKSIRRGETFSVVFWSPNLADGMRVRYSLCFNKTKGEQCNSRKSWVLEGGYEYDTGWTVEPNEGRWGILTITLKVEGRRVASKSLRLVEN